MRRGTERNQEREGFEMTSLDQLWMWGRIYWEELDKTVNSVLNGKSSGKYIATVPRIDTRGNIKERRPKEKLMCGVRRRMFNRGQREEDNRDGDI